MTRIQPLVHQGDAVERLGELVGERNRYRVALEKIADEIVGDNERVALNLRRLARVALAGDEVESSKL